jgi:hypothetical protein
MADSHADKQVEAFVLREIAECEALAEGQKEFLRRLAAECTRSAAVASESRCFDAAFKALERLDSVRFMWNGPIHQAAALLREATGPQTINSNQRGHLPQAAEASGLTSDGVSLGGAGPAIIPASTQSEKQAACSECGDTKAPRPCGAANCPYDKLYEDFEELAKQYKLKTHERADALRWFLLGKSSPSAKPAD